MNDAITIITPKSLAEARELASILSKSSLLPDAFRGKEAETLMIIMTGAELGLAPMQSLRAFDVVKGKPCMKAEGMTAIVRGRRDVCEYLVINESTAKRCTMTAKRVGDPSPTTMSFTLEDAAQAGLLANDNYKKYPGPMLRARCGSAICKAVFSDLILGLYDPDELAADAPAPRQAHVVDAVVTVLPPVAAPTPPAVVAALLAAPAPTPSPAKAPRRRMPVTDVVTPAADPVTSEADALFLAVTTAATSAALAALMPRLRALPESERVALRPAYEARSKALARRPGDES